MTAPVYIVIIAALVGLLLGACLGIWLANREWIDEHETDMPSRIVGPGLPTEEAEDVEDWKRRGWL